MLTMNSWLMKLLFCISFIAFIIGGYFKIMHIGTAYTYLMIGVITGLFCLAFALFEIFSSKRIKTIEKLVWMIGFFTTGWIALLIYVFMGRNEVISNTGVTNMHTI